jgi:hypothetical protein
VTISQVKRVRRRMKVDTRYRKALMKRGTPIKEGKKK